MIKHKGERAMMFTTGERRLIILYYSETRKETISSLWDTLPFIDDEDILESAWSAIGKLNAISDAEFYVSFEGEAIGYAG